jgi:hypothetical protein
VLQDSLPSENDKNEVFVNSDSLIESYIPSVTKIDW